MKRAYKPPRSIHVWVLLYFIMFYYILIYFIIFYNILLYFVISVSLSLPSLFMKDPGQKAAGLRPNINTNSFCPAHHRQYNRTQNHKPSFSESDWMFVCATSYNGSRLSDVLCSKYLGWISCPPHRWISRITPQHRTTFWNIKISKQLLLVEIKRIFIKYS